MTALVTSGPSARGSITRALVALAALLLVFAAASGAVPLVDTVGLLAVVVAALVAQRYPAATMCVALALVVLVPIYWGRPTITKSLVAVPATVAAVVLLLPALAQLPRFRPQALDLWFGAFVLFLALGALLNVPKGVGAATGILWRYLLPYVVWRLVSLRWLHWPTVLRVLVGAGVVLSGFAIEEKASGRNPFFTWVHPVYQADQWARSSFRNHVIRTEASFGEPISFGCFLAVCVVAAVTLLVLSHRLLVQAAAAAAIVVMMIAIVDSQSRAALGMAVVGAAAQLLRLFNPRRAARIIVAVGLAVLAVVMTPIAGEVQHAVSSRSGTTSEALSAQYRLAVLDVLESPKYYSLIGQRNDQATGVTDLGEQVSGLKSLDNEYAQVLLTGGVLALGALVGLAVTLVASALRVRDQDPASAAMGTALAVFAVVLLIVALLVQMADLFVLGVALLATQRQHDREQRA